MDLQEVLARIDSEKQGEVIAAFKDCKGVEDAKAVVQKFALPISDEEITLIDKQFSENSTPLNNELLGNVTGGTIDPTIYYPSGW